jgi:hypothetical protein
MSKRYGPIRNLFDWAEQQIEIQRSVDEQAERARQRRRVVKARGGHNFSTHDRRCVCGKSAIDYHSQSIERRGEDVCSGFRLKAVPT